MPKITHESSNLYRATLLLKWRENNSWIWTGRNQIAIDTNEEPLILEFNQKTFYFYSTGLEKSNDKKTWNKEWQGHKLALSFHQKEKLTEKLEQCIDHNNWYWKTILLKLKINILEDISKDLTKELNDLLLIPDALLNPKNQNFHEEVNYLSRWIDYNKKKIRNLIYRIHAYDKAQNKEDLSLTINQRIKDLDISINNLLINSNDLIKRNDTLAK